MTTLDVDRPATPISAAPSVRQLARIEAKRFARHPVFLVGLALCAVSTVAVVDDRSPDTMGTGVIPAFFLGVFGFITAYRLARSTRPSAEAVDATPVGDTSRTTALLAACLVPALAGAVWLVVWMISLEVWPPQEWKLGGADYLDQLAVFAGQSVVAGLGGSLLGVTVARWWRFPGAGALGTVLLVAWVLLSTGAAADNRTAEWAEVVRQLAPFALFHEYLNARGLIALTGSPRWYLGYVLVLCALAALAALYTGAGKATRTRILRAGAACVVAAAVFHVLTVTGGQEVPVRYGSDGTTTTDIES